jgi:hypothetical protein
MAAPQEFLSKLEKLTAGCTFVCIPATGCRRFEYCRPNMPYRHPAVNSPPCPAVYLTHAILAIVPF